MADDHDPTALDQAQRFDQAQPGSGTLTAPGYLSGEAEILGPVRLPPGHEAALNPHIMCGMLYSHAISLHNSSYDKPANAFAMTMEDALDVATGMFIKAYSFDLVQARFRTVSEKLRLRDVLPEVPLPAAAVGGPTLDYE